MLTNGVRKAKSRQKPSNFLPLNLVEIQFYYKEKADIHRIKEIVVQQPNHGLLGNFSKSAISLFLAEVLHKSLKTQASDPVLFQFIVSKIEALNGLETGLARFPLQFVVEYCSQLGIAPNAQAADNSTYFDINDGCFTSKTPSHSHYWRAEDTAVFRKSLHITESLELDKSERKHALDLWMHYLRSHLEGFGHLNSLKVLYEVFSS
jgi:DNA repair protein RecO (recombination protein O)